MSIRQALRAASESTTLKGVTPRVLGQRSLMGVWIGALVLGVACLGFGGGLVNPLGALLLVAAFVLIMGSQSWIRRSSVEHNVALEAMTGGRLDDAEARFQVFLRKRRIDQHVASALYDLGLIALRRHRFQDAVHLLRAAYLVEKHRILADAASIAGHAHASLVLALVANGEIDVAREMLAGPVPKGAYAAARALLARSHALFAIRTGDPKTALDVLEKNRRLMQNVLTGNDAALAEVLEASALTALAATPGGTSRAAHPVVVDAEARAFVLRLVPECEPLLVNEAF